MQAEVVSDSRRSSGGDLSPESFSWVPVLTRTATPGRHRVSGPALASAGGLTLRLESANERSIGGSARTFSGAGTSEYTRATIVDGHVAVVFEGVLHDAEAFGTGVDRICGANPARAVAQAYRRWGAGAFTELSGSYALVLLDLHLDRAFVTRDRVGNRSLYWRDASAGIRISTSLVAVLAEPGRAGNLVAPELDPVSLAQSLLGRGIPASNTCYRGVQRVPPGHLLQIDVNGTSIHRYWRPEEARESAVTSGEEVMERFEALFRQAVRRAFGARRPGLYLSGGLDSVAVALEASRHARSSGEDLPLALAMFLPGSMSEEIIQREVAGRLGFELLGLDVGEHEHRLVDEALGLSASAAAPLRNVWTPLDDRLALEARGAGVRHLMTGSGGDEWLSVSPSATAQLLRTLDLRGFVDLARTLAYDEGIGTGEAAYRLVWACGIRPMLGEATRGLRHRLLPARSAQQGPTVERTHGNAAYDWFLPDPEIRSGFVERRAVEASGSSEVAAEGSRTDYLRDMLDTLEHPRRAADLDERHESDARLGVSRSDVFWDADLVEFLFRLPPRHLTRGGRSKAPLRRLVAREFPDLGFEQQRKLNWSDYHGSVLVRGLEHAWHDLDGVPTLASMGLVDAAKLARTLNETPDGPGSVDASRLWRLLSLESWVRPRV